MQSVSSRSSQTRINRHTIAGQTEPSLIRFARSRWKCLPVMAFFVIWSLTCAQTSWSQASALSAVSKAVKPPQAPEAPLPQGPAAGNTVQAIPLPEVADRAEELDRQLEEVSTYLAANRDFLVQNQAITADSTEIKERTSRVDTFLVGSPDILQLRDEIVYWRGLSQQSAELRKMLSGRGADLQRRIALLDEEDARWKATQDQVGQESGIEAVADRVKEELEGIRSVRAQAQEQLNRVLTLQNQLSLSGRQISDALDKLTDTEQQYRGHLFTRNSLPLWNPQVFQDTDQPLEILLRRSADRDYKSTGEFLRAAAFRLLILPLLFVVTVFAVGRLRSYVQRTARGLPEETLSVLAKPYLMASLVTLLFCIPQAGETPSSITLLFYLLWIALIFRLTPLLVPAKLQRIVFVVLALNGVEFCRVGIPFPAAVNRVLLTLILAAALAALVVLARPAVLRRTRLSRWPLLLLTWGVLVGILLLALALVANVCGYTSLSRVLGIGALVSGLYAAGLYCTIRVLLLLLDVFLQSPWASPFSAEIRQTIELWFRRILFVLAFVFWWTHSQIYTLLFRDTVSAATSSILGFTFGLGKVDFTVGTLLSVILIVGIGFLLARIVSSLLRSVLIAKLPIQRGLPYAISKFVYYALILMVLFVAITRAGVELNKFTVITGALGVGVGFGLQNIVNNFASGLILLVERPIRVGDVVEVNGLVGSVGRIGARSSTITTAQGAEVIVPNNNLIANQVVNWTLSSPWRRVEIPVGVAYGSDPKTILKLLVSVAASHADVMVDPPPVAFFLGFGDSALNFELRFWAERQEMWFQLKSDVAVAVANALKQANVEIPFPQRDLHLRSADLSLSERQQLSTELQPKSTGTNADRGKSTEMPADNKVP